MEKARARERAAAEPKKEEPVHYTLRVRDAHSGLEREIVQHPQSMIGKAHALLMQLCPEREWVFRLDGDALVVSTESEIVYREDPNGTDGTSLTYGIGDTTLFDKPDVEVMWQLFLKSSVLKRYRVPTEGEPLIPWLMEKLGDLAQHLHVREDGRYHYLCYPVGGSSRTLCTDEDGGSGRYAHVLSRFIKEARSDGKEFWRLETFVYGVAPLQALESVRDLVSRWVTEGDCPVKQHVVAGVPQIEPKRARLPSPGVNPIEGGDPNSARRGRDLCRFSSLPMEQHTFWDDRGASPVLRAVRVPLHLHPGTPLSCPSEWVKLLVEAYCSEAGNRIMCDPSRPHNPLLVDGSIAYNPADDIGTYRGDRGLHRERPTPYDIAERIIKSAPFSQDLGDIFPEVPSAYSADYVSDWGRGSALYGLYHSTEYESYAPRIYTAWALAHQLQALLRDSVAVLVSAEWVDGRLCFDLSMRTERYEPIIGLFSERVSAPWEDPFNILWTPNPDVVDVAGIRSFENVLYALYSNAQVILLR